MSRHTYGHRVDDVLGRLGIARHGRERRGSPCWRRRNRPEFLDPAARQLRRASATPTPSSSSSPTPTASTARTSTPRRRRSATPGRSTSPTGLTLGECLNAGLDATDARFVAKFDDDDHYGADYLTTRCSCIGSSTPRSSARRRSSPTSRDPTRRSCAPPATSSRSPTGSAARRCSSTVRCSTTCASARSTSARTATSASRRSPAGLTVFSADRYNYVAAPPPRPGEPQLDDRRRRLPHRLGPRRRRASRSTAR